jgi:FixJ family two-component response regulator
MTARKKVVAVVDDHPMMLTAIERLLEALGFAVRVFESGTAFLDIAVTEEFDCVLLDIHLGDMSGFELHRRLKMTRPTLPVIYMTASRETAIREHALKAGCVAFLYKPFPTEPLVEALEMATLKKE